MSSKITLFNTYYNQRKMLKAQFKLWDSYSDDIKSKLRFLIVDDKSDPSNKAVDVLKELNPNIDIKIYEVLEDKYCNIGGGRNLGASVTTTEWFIISDIDHAFPECSIRESLSRDFSDPSVIYRYTRIDMETKVLKEHPAIMLLNKDFYWKVGGCDEDFVGNYGHTDVHFRYRAEKCGCKYLPANETNIQLYREGETLNINRDLLAQAPNQKLFKLKAQYNSWSEDYLRFSWKQVW